MLDTWHTITSFLTPATLFLLLNLVIATIVLSSRRHHGNNQPDQTGTFFAGAYLRTTSPVLERLRSLTLHRFCSGEIPADTLTSSTRPIPIPDLDPISTESEPNPTIGNGTVHFGEVTTIPSPSPPSSPSPSPRPLERTSSILDYIKSINLYRFRSGEIQTEEANTETTTTVTNGTSTEHHYERSRSESSRPTEKKKKVKKTVSVKDAVSEEMELRQRSFRRREVAVEEGVDARADDFINRFKEQLKIQRWNSILNYKEMLNRGG